MTSPVDREAASEVTLHEAPTLGAPITSPIQQSTKETNQPPKKETSNNTNTTSHINNNDDIHDPPSPTETITPPSNPNANAGGGEALAHTSSGELEKQPPVPQGPTYPEGGLMGWMCVVGVWLIFFVTFGYANAFGAFEDIYNTVKYPSEGPSNISWVGSVQLFFQFFMGMIAGPLYDRGFFRQMMVGGSVLYIVCLFMTSLCKEFWQTILAQGIGLGIGVGFMFLPAMSIVSQYFMRRRALAIGIVATGSSTGGIVLPIMINKLFPRYGFEKTIQYTGYLILGCTVLANLLMHPRLPPAQKQETKPSPKEIFSHVSYSIFVAGLFFVVWGLFFPIYFLQVFAQYHHLSTTLITYTLAILNAASVFGRILPNFVADYLGPLNLITIMCAGAGIMIFACFGAGSSAGLICVAIFFGFFSGAYVSLIGPGLIGFARNHKEIGIRVGLGFVVSSFAALSGTPITGALLSRYGFAAPIIFSGVSVFVGVGCFVMSALMRRKEKGTWKV